MGKTKKFSFCFLITITSASFAGAVETNVDESPRMKEGLYVGLGVGGTMYHDTITVSNTNTLYQISKSFNTTDAQASIFAGVGKTFRDKFYLGVEANSYFPNHCILWSKRPGVTVTNLTYETYFLIQDYVNLDLLPGYRIFPKWLIYGRAGISFSNITENQEAISTVPPSNDTNSRIGGRFGAGIAYEMTEHFGAGLDYYYSYYPRSTHNFYGRNTGYQLDSYSNYVGFSLFYTV
jgi:opacity protein-like surface antigen